MLDIIYQYVWFDVFKGSVNVSDVITSRDHEVINVIFAYRNNDLFMWEILSSYFDL